MKKGAGSLTLSAFFCTFASAMVYIDDHIEDFNLEQGLAEISQERREQALRFKHELGRRQCVCAYLLLKRALREEYDITENPAFSYGEHGKPSLTDYPDIHFNLSHCREAVVCIVSDKPVGIDVESVHRYKESLVRFTMSEKEQQAIHEASNPALAFTRLWTMKEARLKLSGEGIGHAMQTVLDDTTVGYETVVSADGRYVYSVAFNK